MSIWTHADLRACRPSLVVLMAGAICLGRASVSAGAAATSPLPENIALRATAEASSEHNQHYLAKFAIDGRGLVQLTDGPWHDYNPCWLPDGGIAFRNIRRPRMDMPGAQPDQSVSRECQ